MSLSPDAHHFVQGVLSCDRAILGQTLTLIESLSPEKRALAEEILQSLMPKSGGSLRVGISGVPGAGKSTLIDRLGMWLIEKGHRVAVLAVDPSSEISGGSLLGDKTRMVRLSQREEAFIRPSPTAGTLGGVASRTREAVFVCEAAGFDVVLVETVGVGQSETHVYSMVDCLAVLLLAGTGDDLQGIKRGIMERADVLAINKADGENRVRAEKAQKDFQMAVDLLRGRSPQVSVCLLSGLEGSGVEVFWESVIQFVEAQKGSGAFESRRQEQLQEWLNELVERGLVEAFNHHKNVKICREDLEPQMLKGGVPPVVVAKQLLRAFGVSVGI